MKIRFEKLFIRFSIDRKLDSIDRKCFDGTDINQASIETDRGWPKFLIASLIDRKWSSIDRNFEKRTNQFIAETPQSIERIKCVSMRWNVFQKHKFWNRFSQNLRFSIHSLKFSSIKYDLHKTLQNLGRVWWSYWPWERKPLHKEWRKTTKKFDWSPEKDV